jgi:hypothetical protein
VTSGADGSGGSMVNALLGTLLRDMIGPKARGTDAASTT